MTYYFVDEKEIDELTYCKDIQTRTKLANVIKSNNKSSKTNYYMKSWNDLKKWLKHMKDGHQNQFKLHHLDESSRSAWFYNFILSKMERVDQQNIVNTKNVITMWFSGKDCKQCGNHIYTDGMMDWCKEGCSKHGNPSSWGE